MCNYISQSRVKGDVTETDHFPVLTQKRVEAVNAVD